MRAVAIIALAVLWSRASFAVRLNVALHAQSRAVVHGWTAGSEVTTRGLARALRAHPSVHRVEVFAPFVYSGLLGAGAVRWDVAIVEGFTGSVPAFVAALRAANPEVVVLQWVLDTYPSLARVLGVDSDGYLVNSRLLRDVLANAAGGGIPSGAHGGRSLVPRDDEGELAHGVARMVPLAADTEEMRPVVAWWTRRICRPLLCTLHALATQSPICEAAHRNRSTFSVKLEPIFEK